MGTWGTGLYSNDDALDMKEMFRNLIAYGKSTQEAYEEIMKEFMLDFGETDNCDAWLALADTAWKYGRLTDQIKKQAISLIDNGDAMNEWESASRQDQKKRIQVLSVLRSRLLSDMPPEKTPKPVRLYSLNWKPGEVYSFKTKEKRYMAMIVVQDYDFKPNKYATVSYHYPYYFVFLDWEGQIDIVPDEVLSAPHILSWKSSESKLIVFLHANIYEFRAKTHELYKYQGSIPGTALDKCNEIYKEAKKWEKRDIDLNQPWEAYKNMMTYRTSDDIDLTL